MSFPFALTSWQERHVFSEPKEFGKKERSLDPLHDREDPADRAS
jgi:hypothetical protein